MRILPKSAQETKAEFFGKRGWTLHTILIFTKKNNCKELDVKAYDHWSTDTKQDAWFTASSFEAVFETIKYKPRWIRIISDNGAHYHSSELMAIVAHWNEWYQIEVRDWQFLEPGEAKTTINSHHAAVSTIVIYSNCNRIHIKITFSFSFRFLIQSNDMFGLDMISVMERI
jgi:hypothetical protein